MKYKYQLIVLGSDVSQKNKVLSTLSKKIKDLGLPDAILRIIEADKVSEDYLRNQPAFALYFGDKDRDHKHVDIADKLLKDCVMILPIVFSNPDDGAFLKEIPLVLSKQNGVQFKESELDRIANIILESFELLRCTRKIFISYRRSESTSVAIQLYEILEAYNYDVFLDTHSIAKGESFHDELWHRMTDCDVIVLLNTPKFLESKWCKDEFAEASTKRIGLVQLVWPNHTIKNMDSSSHLSYPIQLEESDFVDNIYRDKDKSKLRNGVIEKIIQKVEEVRARNLASRQDSLITDFRNIAEQCNRKVILQPERFLTEDLPSGKRVIYIPCIGVPQSTSCQSAEIRHEMDKHNNIAIRLIYDDLRIRDKWLQHLDWLNSNLKCDIQTLKKQDFKSWLQTMK